MSRFYILVYIRCLIILCVIYVLSICKDVKIECMWHHWHNFEIKNNWILSQLTLSFSFLIKGWLTFIHQDVFLCGIGLILSSIAFLLEERSFNVIRKVLSSIFDKFISIFENFYFRCIKITNKGIKCQIKCYNTITYGWQN